MTKEDFYQSYVDKRLIIEADHTGIYAGNKVHKGKLIQSSSQEVTGEACNAVAEYTAMNNGITIVHDNGKPIWRITVERIKDET